MDDFGRAIRPHLPAAWNLARWLMRDAAAAEDAVQEACVRGMRHFGAQRDVKAWFLAIVRNCCFTQLGRMGPGSGEDDVVPLPVAPEPLEHLLRADQAKRIEEAVGALRPEFREAFVLRELEGLSYKEIADVAGVPIGTVMSRLSRARRDLQAALADEQRKAGAR